MSCWVQQNRKGPSNREAGKREARVRGQDVTLETKVRVI